MKKIGLGVVTTACAIALSFGIVSNEAKATEMVATTQTPATTEVTATTETTVTTEQNEYPQGKVYSITPKTKPVKGSVINTFTTVNKKTLNYYTIRSYMEKFQKAKKGTLILKKGTYNITNTIYVPSNVTIIFEDGVKLNKTMKTGVKKVTAATSIFQLVRPSKAEKKKVYGKYNGEKNIHFVGKGSVSINLKNVNTSIAIIMGHNQNVTIDNISFSNVNTGHFIEMDASKDISVTNCRFANAKKGSDYVKEAINIDTPDRTTKGFSQMWSKFDKTANCNVLIDHCTFTNMGRAIGTHKYSAKGSTQMYHTGITITNNTITDMKKDAPIRVMNWKDSNLSNNVINGVKDSDKSDTRGILVSGGVNVNISDNVISGVGRAIQCIAWKNDGDGSGYPVTYNAFTPENVTALGTNKANNLSLGEYFVRMTTKYNVYDDAEKIPILFAN